MNESLILECPVHFHRRARGRNELITGVRPAPPPCPLGRVPRDARLAALALRFDQQIRDGAIASYSEIAAVGHVTRARVSQIMNLINLAPDVLEAVLFLPRTVRRRDPIQLRHLQPIASTFDWRKQRRQWRELAGRAAR